MRRFLCVLVALSVSSVASAAGFYNTPAGLQQCLGVGFGPGYHAPLLLGFPLTARTASQPIRWTGPYPPRGAHSGFAAPSSYIASEAPVVMETHHAAVPHHVEHPVFSAPPVTHPPEQSILVAPANGPYVGHEVVPAPKMMLPRGG